MSKIEGVFLDYKFCNQPKCKRKNECLRYKSNIPWNVVCSVMNRPECSKSNNYKLILLEPPSKNELPKDYFGYDVGDNSKEIEEVTENNVKYCELGVIKQYTKDISFYIEPFIKNSKTIYQIQDIPNIFGTDLDKKAVEGLIAEHNLNSKHFLVSAYTVWDRILLKENYKGKCLVYCNVPEDIDKEFYTRAKQWSLNNYVLLHTKQTPDEYKKSFTLEDDTVIYEL